MQLADLEGRERTAEHKSLQKSNFPLLPCFPPLDLSYRGAVFRGEKLLSDFKACARLKKRKVRIPGAKDLFKKKIDDK